MTFIYKLTKLRKNLTGLNGPKTNRKTKFIIKGLPDKIVIPCPEGFTTEFSRTSKDLQLIIFQILKKPRKATPNYFYESNIILITQSGKDKTTRTKEHQRTISIMNADSKCSKKTL